MSSRLAEANSKFEPSASMVTASSFRYDPWTPKKEVIIMYKSTTTMMIHQKRHQHNTLVTNILTHVKLYAPSTLIRSIDNRTNSREPAHVEYRNRIWKWNPWYNLFAGLSRRKQPRRWIVSVVEFPKSYLDSWIQKPDYQTLLCI